MPPGSRQEGMTNNVRGAVGGAPRTVADIHTEYEVIVHWVSIYT